MEEQKKISSTQKLLDIIKKNTVPEYKNNAEMQWVRLNKTEIRKRPLSYLFVGAVAGIIATGGIFYLLRNSDLVKSGQKPAYSQDENIIQPQFPGTTLPALTLSPAKLNLPPDSESRKPTTAEKLQTVSNSKENNKDTDIEKIIQDNLANWKAAWERKDINAYKAFYSPLFYTRKFDPGKFDRRTWLDNKEKIFQQPGDILINIEELTILVKGSLAISTFVQHFKSPGLTDDGIKILLWLNENNEWKIISEKWKAVKK